MDAEDDASETGANEELKEGELGASQRKGKGKERAIESGDEGGEGSEGRDGSMRSSCTGWLRGTME